MARSAFLAGRALADLCRSVLALGFMIGLGLLVGFRFHSSVAACLAGIALIILFGYAFIWVYAAVGLAVRDPQTAQIAAILPMFILFFASSAVVPVATMPGWLQPFPRNQPASVVINSVRALFEGGPLSPGSVAGHRMVSRDLGRLLRGLAQPVSPSHGVGRGCAEASPAVATAPNCCSCSRTRFANGTIHEVPSRASRNPPEHPLALIYADGWLAYVQARRRSPRSTFSPPSSTYRPTRGPTASITPTGRIRTRGPIAPSSTPRTSPGI